MKLNTIYEGKCLDVIRTFPDKSIDCVITSPPYWQLRDYGWDGQWGNEPTFQMYLENLWSLMDEIYRVLKDSGTVWINLGDTYGTKSGNFTGGNTVENKISYTGTMGDTYTKDAAYHKCLLLIPHRFAIGCIDRGWVMRNDIIWAKPNAMPESVTDRFSKKHEYFFLMVKSDKYYFDLDSIRDTHKASMDEILRQKRINTIQGSATAIGHKGSSGGLGYGGKKNIVGNMNESGLTRTTAGLSMKSASEKMNILGKNPGSVSDFWDIPTIPSQDKHFASYNTNLIDKPIIAGCPKEGIILDPFCGTATTGCRAIDLQRKFIGIEGKPEYVEIGNKKLTPFIISQQLFT